MIRKCNDPALWCRDCLGKGRRRVVNPLCNVKTVLLPCFRCDDTGIDPGPTVECPENGGDLEVERQLRLTPKK